MVGYGPGPQKTVKAVPRLILARPVKRVVVHTLSLQQKRSELPPVPVTLQADIVGVMEITTTRTADVKHLIGPQIAKLVLNQGVTVLKAEPFHVMKVLDNGK